MKNKVLNIYITSKIGIIAVIAIVLIIKKFINKNYLGQETIKC